MNDEDLVYVLAVDDQPNNLLALETIFADSDISLITANSGKEALKNLLDFEFAVILMDAQMPVMDGFETARSIRSREKTRYVPIIFLTATRGDELDKGTGYDVGAVDYLSKPINPQILKAKVMVFVELFKKSRAIRRQSDELKAYKEELENSLNQLSTTNAELRKLAAIVECTNDAIISVDLEGIVQSWNNAAADMFGYTATEIIGKSVSVLLPGALEEEMAILKALQRRDRVMHFETVRRSRSGRMIDVSITLSPVTDEQGKLIGASNILRDICQQKLYEDALKESKEELEILNKSLMKARNQAVAASDLKSQFVANMSHEIRTPMNGIIGMCDILLNTPLSDSQREYAKAIQGAGNSLLTVINDILDFSKIEAGCLELECISFNIVELIEGTCQLLVTQARSKELSLVSFIDPTMPRTFYGDLTRLRQILMNLVGNAIKFSETGEVVLKATVEKDLGDKQLVCFTVMDNGIGMTTTEQERLFQPFVQADGSISRKFGGTGLGLSICKRLTGLMEGTIAVESIKGRGSAFLVKLPLETSMSSPVISLQEKMKHLKVLVVDDEPHSRETLTSYVSSWGMQVNSTHSSRNALDILRQASADNNPYQVALLDLVMPEMDGIELASKILSENFSRESKLKLILVTAFNSDLVREQAIKMGFHGFLTKPVRQSHLLNSIVEVVNGGKSLKDERVHVNPPIKHYSDRSDQLILVVDDYHLNQQVMQIYLGQMGLSCHVVGNGREAIQSAADQNVALILMDCQMPEMDGFTATNKIREHENKTGVSHIPIIAMTAFAMDGDRERCLSAGMDDYLSKPIDPKQLQRALDKWLPDTSSNAKIEKRKSLDFGTDIVFDVERLENRFGKPGALLLASTFIKETESMMSDLRHAESDRGIVKIVQIAHGLAGASGAVCSDRLVLICKRLDNFNEDCDWAQVSELIDELDKSLKRTLEAINTYIEMEKAPSNELRE